MRNIVHNLITAFRNIGDCQTFQYTGDTLLSFLIDEGYTLFSEIPINEQYNTPELPIIPIPPGYDLLTIEEENKILQEIMEWNTYRIECNNALTYIPENDKSDQIMREIMNTKGISIYDMIYGFKSDQITPIPNWLLKAGQNRKERRKARRYGKL
jgi:hypothetical protein